jgi:hypothetical protein
MPTSTLPPSEVAELKRSQPLAALNNQLAGFHLRTPAAKEALPQEAVDLACSAIERRMGQPEAMTGREVIERMKAYCDVLAGENRAGAFLLSIGHGKRL